MTEIVRRPGRVPVFAQVLVAVLSGAAAMYALQNIQGAQRPPIAPAAPAAPAKTPPRQEPRRARSTLPPPRASRPAAQPPRSAMLIVPEQGGARGGMLNVAGEGAPPGTVGSEYDPGRPLLKSSRGGVRAFDPVDWRRVGKPKPLARPAEKGKTGPALISRGAAPEEGLGLPGAVGAPPAAGPEYWDRDSILRVGAAALLAVAGLLFLLFGTRIVQSTGAQAPPDERR